MITRQNFEQVVQFLGFTQNGTTGVYEKRYDAFDYVITINFKVEKIEYTSGTNPIRVNDQTTSNFSHPENFVVLECVNRLLEKGYRPEHIELEKKWTLGHEEKGGKADICVYSSDGKMLFIVECKTYGKEYKKEYDNLLNNWERESIELLQTSTMGLLTNATIGGGSFTDFDVDSFCEYYREKVKAMQHGANFNAFTSMVKSDAEKYTKRIESTYEDFKRYYE